MVVVAQAELLAASGDDEWVGGFHAVRVATRSCHRHVARAHLAIPGKMDRNVPLPPSIWCGRR